MIQLFVCLVDTGTGNQAHVCRFETDTTAIRLEMSGICSLQILFLLDTWYSFNRKKHDHYISDKLTTRQSCHPSVLDFFLLCVGCPIDVVSRGILTINASCTCSVDAPSPFVPIKWLNDSLRLLRIPSKSISP